MKQKQTHRYREKTSSYQKERHEGRVKWVKRVNCMGMNGNSTFGGEYVVYTEFEI